MRISASRAPRGHRRARRLSGRDLLSARGGCETRRGSARLDFPTVASGMARTRHHRPFGGSAAVGSCRLNATIALLRSAGSHAAALCRGARDVSSPASAPFGRWRRCSRANSSDEGISAPRRWAALQHLVRRRETEAAAPTSQALGSSRSRCAWPCAFAIQGRSPDVRFVESTAYLDQVKRCAFPCPRPLRQLASPPLQGPVRGAAVDHYFGACDLQRKSLTATSLEPRATGCEAAHSRWSKRYELDPR